VDSPEDVSVTDIGAQSTTVIELKVARSDIGKVIGTHGRTADAMSTILSAAGKKLNKRAVLEILE